MSGDMDFTRIKKKVLQLTGFEITPDKEYLIQGRLGALLSEFGLESYDQLLSGMEADHTLTCQVIERITTHETLFFRDESVYGALVNQILPEWLSRNAEKGFRRLSIWSAGCATGQEPLSILMMIQRFFPELYSVTAICATDVSPISITQARVGRFTELAISRGLSPEWVSRHFKKDGNQFVVSEEIKSKIGFTVHNLLDMPYLGEFDIIFCRNVLIYFDANTRRKVIESFRRVLKADGILVLGSAESLQGSTENYVLRECGLARYYELNSSNVTIFPNSFRLRTGEQK